MTTLFCRAGERLRSCLAGRPLIVVDRFGSAGRNTPCLGAAMTISYYAAWGESQVRNLNVESKTRVRDPARKHGFVSELRTELQRAGIRSPYLLVWYETDELLSLATALGGELLCIPRHVREALEDKTQLLSLLEAADVPSDLRIDSMNVAGVAALPPFRVLEQRFGLPFVVQTNSSGGRGTVFIGQPKDLQQTAAFRGSLRLSRYVAGFSSNTTVLTVPRSTTDCAVYVDAPSHKAMGVSAVGIHGAKGAGNDWSIPFPRKSVECFVDAVERIGKYAYRTFGLTGLWGVDSIWTSSGVVINELNVRNQGTTEVSAVNQQLRGLPPFLAAHAVSLLGGIVDWLPEDAEHNAETIRLVSTSGQLAPFYLKIRNTFGRPVRPLPTFKGSGLYRFSADVCLDWSGPAVRTIDANFLERNILVANAARPDIRCESGAELGTLEGLTTSDFAIFSASGGLSPLGTDIADAYYKWFSPVER